MRVESLPDCLTRVYSLCESEAASRGHLFRLDLSDEPIQIVMDRDKIIQVLINLIRNSFQAMEHTGTVRLSLRAEERMAVVEVEDTGKALPMKIWSRFLIRSIQPKKKGPALGCPCVKNCRGPWRQNNGSQRAGDRHDVYLADSTGLENLNGNRPKYIL